MNFETLSKDYAKGLEITFSKEKVFLALALMSRDKVLRHDRFIMVFR